MTLAILLPSLALASLSVFTKGNPRTYLLKESTSTPQVKEAELFFEGPDLKKAFFIFQDGRGLYCEKARLLTSDGSFECQGYFKRNDTKESLSFKFSLEPIKNGFDLKGKIKKHTLNLQMSFTKK
jgi:hypothetical protein